MHILITERTPAAPWRFEVMKHSKSVRFKKLPWTSRDVGGTHFAVFGGPILACFWLVLACFWLISLIGGSWGLDSA